MSRRKCEICGEQKAPWAKAWCPQCIRGCIKIVDRDAIHIAVWAAKRARAFERKRGRATR